MRKIKSIILANVIVFSIVGLNYSCSNDSNSTTEETSDYIEISSKQFESEKMQIGKIQEMEFASPILLTGIIYAPISSVSQISTPIGGIVENISFENGASVYKGQILFYLSSLELIGIQQEFAETAISIKKLKSDYERMQSLSEDKIVAEKELIAAESAYKTALIKYESLKVQLSKLRINTDKIEQGNYYSSIPIVAPVKGTINFSNIVNGQFVDQHTKLIEIINGDNLELKLSAFEKDLAYLEENQKLEFYTLNNPKQKLTATISKIGNSINPETGAVDVYAKPENSDSKTINSAAIEALVNTGSRLVKYLPESAVVKSGKNYFIYIINSKDKDKYLLSKVKVNIGQKYNGYVEIIDPIIEDDILVSGVNNLSIE